MQYLKLIALTTALMMTALATPIKDNTISGKITDWPAGKTGEVQLRRLDYVVDKPDAALATATVNEQGEFSLKLPDAAALAKILPDKDSSYVYGGSCQGSLTLEPAAQIDFFDLIAMQDGKEISNVKYRTSRTPWPQLLDNFRFQGLVFSTADTRIDGAASCDLSNSPYYDQIQTVSKMRVESTADLKAGWNTLSGTDSGSKTIFTGDPMPKEAFWHVQIGYGGVGLTPKVTEDKKNIRVVALTEGGPAQSAGVKVDDLVLAVDDTPVNPENLTGMAQKVRGEEGTTVVLTVKRGTETIKIPIKRKYVQVK